MAPARAGARKTVTAVFCDVVGSTALGQRLDPESVRSVMESYFAAVSAVLTRHGGTVEKFVGDAVMAVFGVPVAHEDDAVAGPEDHELRGRAHEALSSVYLMSAQFGEQARQLQAACHDAVLAGDHRLAGWLRRSVFGPLIHGDYPASAGLAYAQSALATAADRLAKVSAANAVAYFARQLGRPDEALPARQLAHRLAHESRRPHVVAGVAMDLGEVEMTAGDLGESLQILAEGGRAMTAVGDLSMLATLAALHAHALLHADQIDAAKAEVATALHNAPAEDAVTHGLAAAASAWLAGLAGDAAAVDRQAASAVRLLEATDALEVRAIARVACAQAASLVGDRKAVARHRAIAVEAFAAKGNIVAADRQRALL